MSIQIIDGFKLNSNTPIDSRIVTSGTASRNSMQYKYNGLRVFDTVQLISFVWINNNWIKDNESGGGVVFATGTGAEDYLLKSATGGKFGNSIIFDNGTNVGIGTNVTDQRLVVSGNVKATSYIGSGQNLTDLDADKITNGSLSVVRIKNGSNNQILTTSGGVTTWMNPSELVSGKVSISYRVSTTPPTTDQFLTFVDNTTDQSIHINPFIKINNTDSQILASDQSNNKFLRPSYSFINNKTVGIYLTNTSQVGISTGLNINGSITFREDGQLYFIRGNGFGGAIRFLSNANVTQSIGLQIGEFRSTTFTPHIKIELDKTFFEKDIYLLTNKKIFLGPTANITNENSNIVINTGSTFTPTQFRAPDGTTGLPGISFASDTTSGMRKTNGILSLVNNGSDRIEMISSGGFININGSTRIYNSLLVNGLGNNGLTVNNNTILTGNLDVNADQTTLKVNSNGVSVGGGSNARVIYNGWMNFSYNNGGTPKITIHSNHLANFGITLLSSDLTVISDTLSGYVVLKFDANFTNNEILDNTNIQITNKYVSGYYRPFNYTTYTENRTIVIFFQRGANKFVTNEPAGTIGIGNFAFYISICVFKN